MVSSTVLKCNFCNRKILTRFQVGYNDIPFDFYCPCGVSINGKYHIENHKLELSNAEETEQDPEKADYYITLSSEFYSIKLCKYNGLEDMLSNSLSPFMNSIMCFDSQNNIMEAGKKVSKYLNYQKNDWPKIKPLYELFFNHKIDLIKKPIANYSIFLKVENDLDAYMALHQINVVKVNSIFNKDILKDYTNIAHEIFDISKKKELIKFINYIKEKEKFDLLSKKIFEVYNDWIENFDKYLPIVYMSFANNKDALDLEKYGITTISFEELKSFYVKSYELILELLIIPIGLNNIFERGNYNEFYNESKAKTMDSFYKLSKYDRVYAISDEDKFSKFLNLNRHVRNSISHFDYEYDKLNQIITFYDRYKGNISENKIYLREFAEICFDNFKLLVYINELFYSIRKIDYIELGNFIHIKESI